MRKTLDTSAFLPCRGKYASAYQNTWQRFTLSLPDEATWEQIMWERDTRYMRGRGIGRAYDRRIVRRYSV